MKNNLCPLCRQSMRFWALDWRAGCHRRSGLAERTLIRTAVSFRDECLHDDLEKYLALVAKLNGLKSRGTPLAMAIWQEIERIKNLHHGHPPKAGACLAWAGRRQLKEAA